MRMNFYSCVVLCCLCLSSCERIKGIVEEVGDLTDEVGNEDGYALVGNGFEALKGKSLDRTIVEQTVDGKFWAPNREGKREVSTGGRRSDSRVWVQVLSGNELRCTLLKNMDVYQMGDAASGKIKKTTKSNPFVKVPLIVDYKKGSWAGQFEKGRAKMEHWEDIAAVQKMVAGGEYEGGEFFGTKRRRVGDEWEISPEYFKKMMSKGSGRIKFSGLQEVDGHECAVLEGSWESQHAVPGVSGSQKMKFKIYRSTEYFVNLRVEADGSMLAGKSTDPFGSTGRLEHEQSTKIVENK